MPDLRACGRPAAASQIRRSGRTLASHKYAQVGQYPEPPLVTPYARRCWMRRRPPDAVVGFGSQRIMEDVMGKGSGLSRGDRNRHARLARLRELVPLSNAIVGIDLADGTQAAVVTDRDSRVIACRRVSVRAWELGDLLDWAVARASAAGFSSVTVACEPTGHRWRVLDQLAAGRGLALVCVQPLLVYRAREGEDLTRDKSDPKDAVLIARLASELRCYEPERADAVWA